MIDIVKETNTPPRWIPVAEELPEQDKPIDIWLTKEGGIEYAHSRADYRFREIGNGNKLGFQEAMCAGPGCYEMAFMLDEGIVTHWKYEPEEYPE